MMYLNVNLAANASSGAEGSCTTPRTPEILNLLSGAPFDNVGFYNGSTASYNVHRTSNNRIGTSLGFNSSSSSLSAAATATAAAASTPGDGPSSPREHASFSSMSSMSSLSSPGTPSTPSSLTGPPSIQNTRTFLIKEGLKLTIQSKRLASGRTMTTLETEQSYPSPKDELTVEDEERRRRRRERNKVAATKCRHRKKERTVILMQESDSLEDHNVSLRTEIQRLETEKRRLMDVLAMHSPNCIKTGHDTPSSCSDYMNVSADGQDSHYVMAGSVTTAGVLTSTYADCPGQRHSPNNQYANSSNIYDCRAPSATPVISAGQSVHPNFDLSSCMNTFTGESCTSYEVNLGHRASYNHTDNSGQNYR